MRIMQPASWRGAAGGEADHPHRCRGGLPADAGRLEIHFQDNGEEISDLVEEGQINGDDPKVESCLRALNKVLPTHLIDGRRAHALILEIFTDAGIGTMVTL